GYLDPTSPGDFAGPRRAFLQGLKEAGYVEGENVAISYRSNGFMKAAMTRLPTGVSLRRLPPRLPRTLSRFRLVYRSPRSAPFTVPENGTPAFRFSDIEPPMLRAPDGGIG